MQEKNLTPDYNRMVEHLTVLFDGYDQYKDGLIEIAYTNEQSGAVLHAKLFQVDQIGDAASFAFNVNQKNGVNVYVGGALRSPDSDPNVRSSVGDFYACNTLWVDLDDEGATTGVKEKYKDLPPSYIVVTGRHPHTRAQAWWKLDDAVTRLDLLRPALAGLCHSLGGDRAVVDPARVMRLAGSIAWPKKEGRVTELTVGSRPSKFTETCAIERVMLHFPGGAVQLTTSAPSGGVASKFDDGKPRNPFTGKLNILSLLEATKRPHEWHVNMRDAIASMVSSGWSDQQIRLACAPYCQGGPSDPDLAPLIGSGRHKWNMPEPDTGTPPEAYNPKTGAITPQPDKVIRATPVDDLDLDSIKPREFLYGDVLARKYVSMIIAPPGAGKSIFSMQIGVSAVSNVRFGDWVPKINGLNVWVYNNEEGGDELLRRLKGIMLANNIKKQDLIGRLYMDSGEHQSINIAKSAHDTVIQTPDYAAMLEEIKGRKIDILIVDPFAETHTVPENSNDGMKVVTALYRKIAFDANCAVLLIHHAKKWSEGMAGNADSGRGGGSQIGVVRRAFTLAKMSKEEAEDMGVPAEKRHWYVRFDDAKSNITAPTEQTKWFKFRSVNLMNGNVIYPEGDSVGVLEQVSIDQIKEETGGVLSNNIEKVLSYICMYSDGAGGKSFPFSDARDYIMDKDRSIGGRQKVTNIMRDAIGNGCEYLYLGTLYGIKTARNTAEKGKEYIFVGESKNDY